MKRGMIATLFLGAATFGTGPTAADLKAAEPAADPNANAGFAASAEEAAQSAVNAYVFLYPLVTMDLTERVSTNVTKAGPTKTGQTKAPVNAFANHKQYPVPSDHSVTAPNADTLYSTAWLDLSKEPMVFSHPDMGKRFYMFPVLDAYTNVLRTPGTRDDGGAAATYVITGPEWQGGKLPAGAKEIKSPTNTVWILGRTYSSGTPQDYAEVHKLQAQYDLHPLSAAAGYKAPAGKIDPKLDEKTSVRDQVDALSAQEFFTRGAALMGSNRPSNLDRPIVAQMAKVGLRVGQPFDMSKLPKGVSTALAAAPKLGQERIKAQLAKGTTAVNGWMLATKTGRYGADYDQRALVTAIGLGANMPDQAIYPFAEKDSEGQALTGATKYVIHFASGAMPPAKGFWSLTMYTPQMFFFPNALNRFTVSARTEFHKSADGSVDVYVQHERPKSKDEQANWLPAPTGGFALMLRLYWPDEKKPSILDGSWKLPGVTPANPVPRTGRTPPVRR